MKKTGDQNNKSWLGKSLQVYNRYNVGSLKIVFQTFLIIP